MDQVSEERHSPSRRVIRIPRIPQSGEPKAGPFQIPKFVWICEDPDVPKCCSAKNLNHSKEFIAKLSNGNDSNRSPLAQWGRDSAIEICQSLSKSYNDSQISSSLQTEDRNPLPTAPERKLFKSVFQRGSSTHNKTKPPPHIMACALNGYFPNSSRNMTRRSVGSPTKTNYNEHGPKTSKIITEENAHNGNKKGTNCSVMYGVPDCNNLDSSLVPGEFALNCLTDMCPSEPSSRGDGSLSSEETLQGLKKELERCLTMYRTKRQQVTNLQDELRKTR